MHRLTKVALVAAMMAAPLAANARSGYLTDFNTKYGTRGSVLDNCNLCHPNGTSSFNGYGTDLSAANIATNTNNAFTAVEPKDSDGDGYTNLTEIRALTSPGDATKFPAPTPTPQIAVSPTSLSFGTVNVGTTSASQSVQVSNGGTAALSVTIARCTGTSSEFTTSVGSLSVAAGGRATFTVAYAPTAAGTDTGCIALANNAATGTVNVAVSGTGQAVVVTAPKFDVAPTTLALGTVAVGSRSQATTTVSNTGTADLVVSVARCATTSAEFSASPASFTVAAGGTQTVTVAYAPVDATTDSGCFAFTHNDATTASPANVQVSGTGQAVAAPVVDVDITRFSVPKRVDISRGGTITPKVAVMNSGTVAGTVTITLSGAYSASQDVTLAPGETAKVSFPTFTPTAAVAGDVTWTVTVVDEDPDADTATATTKIVP